VFVLTLVPNKLVSEVEKGVIIRAVGHPFLVQLFTYFQNKEPFCYVMENCEGGTLDSLLSKA
jgi:serine/threonine protein kinase